MPRNPLSKSASAQAEPAYVFAAPGSIPPRQRLTQALAAGSLLALAAQPFWRPLPRAAVSTFTVTNLNPAGAGSLVQAIHSANIHPGPDTIAFSPSLNGTIHLTGTLRISDTVQVIGPGPGKLSVSAGNAFTVLYLYAPGVSTSITTTISGLTLRDGLGNGNISGGIYSVATDLTLDDVDLIHNTGGGRGGAIDFSANSLPIGLTLRNSLLSGNSGMEGGGIYVRNAPAGLVIQNTQLVSNTATTTDGGGGVYLYSAGHVLIEDSSFVGNKANLGVGGGLRLGYTTSGGITLRRSTLSGNSAQEGGGLSFYKPNHDTLIEDTTVTGNSAQWGGGLDFHNSAGAQQTVRRTTVSGNMATYGGGIYVKDISNLLTIEDSTISGNHGTGSGGGIYVENNQPIVLQNGTVVSNSAAISGGGIQVSNGTLPITDTIIARNSAPTGPDISGTFQLRYDLVQISGTADISNAGGNLFGLDPLLGPLANHGGLTQTHLPRHGSPAINAGDPAFAEPPATDQRGNARVLGGRVDIGAVEIEEVFLPLLRR